MAKKAARRALAGPSPTPQRVAIYARVSTKEQMEKDTIQN
jgi:predicted site-specific integrase-resolvase